MKKLIILGLAGTVGLLTLFSLQKEEQDSTEQNSNQAVSQESERESTQESNKIKVEPINQTYTWSELGIKTIESIEGDHYAFTAFEYDQNNQELIIAGSYEKNQMIFVKDNKTNEVEISDVPLDILVHEDNLYIIGLNKFIVMKNHAVTNEFEHKIIDVTSFDKMLFFDGYVTLLMSDGSSFKYSDGKLSFSESLLTENGKEMWVLKTSDNSFEIKSAPSTEQLNKGATYNEEIGSITLIGEQSTKYYCIVDVIQNTTPISARRDLKCSSDAFKKTVFKLPNPKYSFIKNDIRIHQDHVYSVSLTEQGLTINTAQL